MTTKQLLHKTIIRGLIGGAIYLAILLLLSAIFVAYIAWAVETTGPFEIPEMPSRSGAILINIVYWLVLLSPLLFIITLGSIEAYITKTITNVLFSIFAVAPAMLVIIFGILFFVYMIGLALLVGYAESGGL